MNILAMLLIFLIEEAKDNGGTDNVTAIVIEPFDEEVDRC